MEYEAPAHRSAIASGVDPSSMMGRSRTVCIPAVYQKITNFNGDLPFPTPASEMRETTAQCAIGTAAQEDASAFVSPVKKTCAARCATPQSSAKFENVLGSPLRGGAKRVAVTVAPSPMRGLCATPGRKTRVPTVTTFTATPAVTDAVVSAEAKAVILSLLRPVSSQRITAQELLDSAWLDNA